MKGEAMIRECYLCREVFGQKEPLEDKSVTSGTCPSCYPKEMQRIEKELRQIERSKRIPAAERAA